MTLSNVFEVGLGLILVYYVVSAIVTSITYQVNRIRSLGAKTLAAGLRDMLDDEGIFDQLYEHKLIQDLTKRRVTFFGKVVVRGIDFIPSQTFALALFDVLAPGIKKDEDQALAGLRETVSALPDSKTKEALEALLASGENTLEKAQQRVAAWFDSVMAGVSDLYTQYARRIAWIVALVVTLVLGVDSVGIARTLWEQPTVRAAAAAEAAAMAGQEQLDLTNASEVQSLLDQIGALNIPLTWFSSPLPATPADWLLKLVGLSITCIAAAQGAPFWYDLLKKLKPA